MQRQNSVGSEVMRLRAQIEREHQAASWALTGLAVGSAQHRFITRRLEQIDAHRERLSALIGERASTMLLVQILEDGPDPKRGPHE